MVKSNDETVRQAWRRVACEVTASCCEFVAWRLFLASMKLARLADRISPPSLLLAIFQATNFDSFEQLGRTVIKRERDRDGFRDLVRKTVADSDEILKALEDGE